MKSNRLLSVFLLLGLLLAPLSIGVRPAASQPVYTCLPSCEANDGRMLSIAGVNLATMVGIEISLSIAAPAGSTALEIGIFDGDTGGIWDVGTQELEYTLYADPTSFGETAVQLGQWSSTAMPDNAWFTIPVAITPAAQAASGHYFYHLRVRALSADTIFYNLFKVRSDGVTSLLPRPFSYFAGLVGAINIIYPNYPDLSVTTYNGDFDFHSYRPSSHPSYVLYDGDVDFGANDGSTADSDDPNTPNDSLPPFATGSAVFEGVASGVLGSTGNPPDDFVTNNLTRRSPSVNYTVNTPSGSPYHNPNPSGNVEWERFDISSNPADGADHTVASSMPAGLYHIHMEGMDMLNLNAWRFQYKLLGVCDFDPATGESNPCKEPLHPKMIGDTVFKDFNMNGVQDANEPGIPNVQVQLFDGSGGPILDIFGNPILRMTDANGHYAFDVEPYQVDEYTGEVVIDGVYTVVVTDINFTPGHLLNNLVSTTGGNSQTNTVTTANVMTYDFGYFLKPQPKGFVMPVVYWRTHPNDWMLQTLVLGGKEYTKAEVIQWMGKVVKGTKVVSLFNQLAAAKLNVAGGNPSACIDADIAAADAWLALHPPEIKVSAKSAAWKEIRASHDRLLMYNAGRLCAPGPGKAK